MCFRVSDEMEPIVSDWNMNEININKAVYKLTYYNPYNGLFLKTEEYNNINDIAQKLKITPLRVEQICKNKKPQINNIKIEKIYKPLFLID